MGSGIYSGILGAYYYSVFYYRTIATAAENMDEAYATASAACFNSFPEGLGYINHIVEVVEIDEALCAIAGYVRKDKNG